VASASAHSDVSIVIPAWGDYAGTRLDEALASLRGQDLQARIVVVDNASDPPLDVPGVTVVRSGERLSVGAARNLGLARVDTPYVLFWADDLMLPGTLRFLRNTIADHDDAVLVAAAILEGDPPVPHRWPRRWIYPLTRWQRTFAVAHCVWSLFPTTGASIMRTQAAREHGFSDANSGEDWVLGVSLAFRGRVLLKTRPGRLYRRHATSLWETQHSGRQLVRNAAIVRARIRVDAGALRGTTLLLPVIAILQLLAIWLVRPLVQMMRVIRPMRRSVR
jgi:glycosyltransferase involved in cell wall biosynthesis